MSELANDRAEEVAHELRRRNPSYLKCDANWRSIVGTMAHNLLGEDDLETEDAQDLLISGGHWTLQNLTVAYKTLDRAGALLYPSNHAHTIKEAQKLRGEQYAANGDVLGGICGIREGKDFRGRSRPDCFHPSRSSRIHQRSGKTICHQPTDDDFSMSTGLDVL